MHAQGYGGGARVAASIIIPVQPVMLSFASVSITRAAISSSFFTHAVHVFTHGECAKRGYIGVAVCGYCLMYGVDRWLIKDILPNRLTWLVFLALHVTGGQRRLQGDVQYDL